MASVVVTRWNDATKVRRHGHAGKMTSGQMMMMPEQPVPVSKQIPDHENVRTRMNENRLG